MRMQRVSVGVVLVVAASALLWGLIVRAPAHAAPRTQPGDPLRYGETVSGEITASEPCRYYTFTGTAGDPITIDMTRTAGNLDGYLRLYQGDGGWQADGTFTQPPAAENDDRPGGSLDPLITITLPLSAPYTIAACRLQAERMTATTGTFTLTLAGPDAPLGPTATPAGALSSAVFGSTTATPTPDSAGGAPPTPAPTEAGPLSGVLADGTPPELSSSAAVSGTLGADLDHVRHTLPVSAGDYVTLTLTRTSGDFAPALHVLSADGADLAAAAAPDSGAVLVLSFRVPQHETLWVDVARGDGSGGGTAGDFQLAVMLEPGASAAGDETTADESAAEEPALTPTPQTDYLADPCSAGNQAVSGLASTARLVDVYTAAGDSYYAAELTQTDVFRTDDDLNVVFRVQNVDAEVTVAGVFCAPDGTYQDAGDSTVEAGGPYLLGIDWEYEGVPWVTGDWTVEVYVDGSVEIVLAFTVE